MYLINILKSIKQTYYIHACVFYYDQTLNVNNTDGYNILYHCIHGSHIKQHKSNIKY